MSALLLRKSCQPILDEAGLPEYHVEVTMATGPNSNGGRPLMMIVGECGKPLTTVKGIVFNRVTISKAEMEYATVLFQFFVTSHIATIADYIAAKNRLTSSAYSQPPEWMSILPRVRHKGTSRTITQIAQFRDKGLFWEIDQDDRLFAVSIPFEGGKEPYAPWLELLASGEYQLDKELRAEALAVLREYIKHQKAKDVVDGKRDLMNSCKA